MTARDLCGAVASAYVGGLLCPPIALAAVLLGLRHAGRGDVPGITLPRVFAVACAVGVGVAVRVALDFAGRCWPAGRIGR